MAERYMNPHRGKTETEGSEEFLAESVCWFCKPNLKKSGVRALPCAFANATESVDMQWTYAF